MSKLNVKMLVETRSDENNSVCLKSVNLGDGGEDFLLICTEDNSYNASFTFDSPQEAKAFFKRVLDQVESFV
jgi:hypothetical protein